MRLFSFHCLLLLISLLNSVFAFSQKNWPKEIPIKSTGGKITIYQPQPETYSGVTLTGRAAVSVRKTATAEPIFGAMWFKAILNTTKENRTASLESLTMTNSRFSDSVKPEAIAQLNKMIESEAKTWNLEISIDELITTVKAEQQINDSGLKMDPPKIIYRDKATTLVFIDGQPNIKKDTGLKMDRVINTPYLLFKYPDDGKFYLYAGSFWYSSSEVTSGFAYVKELPSKLKELDKHIKDYEAKNKNIKAEDRPKAPTEIIIATEPTELIQTEGAPTFKVIAGTSLLYADNTLDEIFKDVNTQEAFILISGRWYSAPNLSGPWTFNPSDKLPADFAKIPRGSEKDGVLSSVAGTPEAEEAIMEAHIPQTVKVDRKTAKVNVTYDGEPKFNKVENTELELAENSSITVMRSSDGEYYAVDNGIWFVSPNPKGPWEVATERPKDVEKIPASNEAYNTKYVYVYDTTPSVVYMGYTPGYMGSYVYGPTIVFGTGFYYPPYYGMWYYPHPVTYGFGFMYNPWMGWGMGWGMSFSFGWMSMGFYGGFYGGWWGPPMYHPPCHGWGWHGGYYGRPGYGGGYPGYGGGGANRPSQLPRVSQPIAGAGANRPNNINSNIYNQRPGASTRDVSRSRPTTGNLPTNRGGSNLGNNVYADRSGNVFRQDKAGNWQQRNNKGGWNSASTNNAFRNELNNNFNQRDRGSMRNNNYQRQMPSNMNRSYSRPSMGARGGGGGRRR